MHNQPLSDPQVGEASPSLFWKSKKRDLVLEKNTLIVFIFGLNFPFNIKF